MISRIYSSLNLKSDFGGQNKRWKFTFAALNTTVTLFSNLFLVTDRGYLVLRKTDDRKVWIIYLESFKPRIWFHVEPEDKRYGSYDIYYHEGWHFERNISSVKWGKWWMGKNLPSLPKN